MSRCVICGRPESEHHKFMDEAIKKPEACVCDVTTWGGNIPEICDSYDGSQDVIGEEWSYCYRCEHDKECHKK